jgi:undecaprenyl-diphosphatase
MLFKYVKNSDLFLLRIFNNSIKCKPLDFVMPLITYLGSFTFTVVFCLATLIYPEPLIRTVGIRASATLVLSTLISQFIKTSVNRIRPFLKVQNLNIKKIGIDEYSFPSGHTTAAFAIAVTLALSFSALTILCISLALLVGISRMYLGVHYPSDVCVGILLGTSCSWLVYFMF